MGGDSHEVVIRTCVSCACAILGMCAVILPVAMGATYAFATCGCFIAVVVGVMYGVLRLAIMASRWLGDIYLRLSGCAGYTTFVLPMRTRVGIHLLSRMYGMIHALSGATSPGSNRSSSVP